jgi:hypothetical protein
MENTLISVKKCSVNRRSSECLYKPTAIWFFHKNQYYADKILEKHTAQSQIQYQ